VVKVAVGDDEQSARRAHQDPKDIKVVCRQGSAAQFRFGVPEWKALAAAALASSAAFWQRERPQGQGETPKKVNISGGVATGMLLQKNGSSVSGHCQAARVSGR